ncbi:hypothetical protein H9L17_06670 [Thermomonas brevis]|uniref:GH18 domain-containing protein n=1 Tax=Thermomonas brevis TaxID=215691 RepID=A0A7G9QWT1_9GAMM|nr:glycosyl hydrolase family 18 protein [Thermomonas brevis]QNN47806.1 hypothetical protein H9L17_06670 [Thermomonas brevis]
MNRHRLAIAMLAGVLYATAASAGEVTTWVPPYQLQQSRLSLQHEAGDVTAGQWITRLGLQFWLPTETGELVFAERGEPLGPADADWFADWGRRNNVKVLLTLYNFRNDHWDWELARSAFRDHPDALVANLLAAVERHGLAGVDLDLEGNGALDADRAAFAGFVAKLSAALKAHGKELTIDSFHSPCFNAPNMVWWEDWQGHVDAIHSMGYGDLYEGSVETFTPEGGETCAQGAALFRYSWQAAWATQHGIDASQVLMGIPGGEYAWGAGKGRRALPAQLKDVQAVGAGIAIWDVNGIATGRWGSAKAWKALEAFRNGRK